MNENKSSLFNWVELEGMFHYLKYFLTLRIVITDETQPIVGTLEILSSHGWNELLTVTDTKEKVIERLKNYADALFGLSAK